MHRSSLVLLILTCSACRTMSPSAPGPSPKSLQVSEQPALRPFARAEHFMLVEPLVVRVGGGADSILIPAGFVSDFASIPSQVQGFISKLGPHLCPAIVHDYLYWEQACTRAEADAIFSKMMAELGTSWVTRKALYWGVALFGGRGWDKNVRLREAGLPRIVPPGARAVGPYETWIEYRNHLKSLNGRLTPPVVMSPRFCSYGKSTRRRVRSVPKSNDTTTPQSAGG